MNPRKGRGKTRQLAAQIAMLYFLRREHGADYFADINAAAVNDFYLSNIDFDAQSPDAKRLIEILNKLNQLLGTGNRPKLRAHDVIHLVLLVDSLWDDYTRSWEKNFSKALDKFLAGFVDAKIRKDSVDPGEFWNRYGQWTRVNSDRGDTIGRRHRFYLEKMYDYLDDLHPKDPQRLFGKLERELLYLKYNKFCAVCDAEVSWNEAEVHHVIEHSKGGASDLSNAALVHKACHPKGSVAPRAFAEKFFASQQETERTSKGLSENAGQGFLWESPTGNVFLPSGTEIRMRYKHDEYFATVDGDQIFYEHKPYTPSQLANTITQTSRNAWRDLWIKFPGDEDWELAENLRSDASMEEDP